MLKQDIEIEKLENFDFFKGLWNGKGSIIILQTGATLHFKLKKIINPIENDKICIKQSIEIQEIKEVWDLNFIIENFENNRFSIQLNSNKLSNLKGDGAYHNNDIDWKFYDAEGKILGKAQFTRVRNNTYLINSTYKFPGKAQISISGILNKSNH